MLSTMYYEIDKGIVYYDNFMKGEFKVLFADLAECYGYDDEPQVYSRAVSRLSSISLDRPHRVYHLAGMVQKHNPELDFAWEKQLLEFEKRVREYKYGKEYYQETGLRPQSYFSNDWHVMDWTVGLHKHLENCESDEQLRQKVKSGIRQWIFPDREE